MKNVKEGKLIIFEGGDGTGKSTQIKLLSVYLQKYDIEIFETKEPKGKFREELFNSNLLPERELELFLECRTEHFSKEVIPNLKNGVWVLCDRCSPASKSYQGYGRGLSLIDIDRRDEIARQGRNFDLVILVDMDSEKALRRIKHKTRFDKEKLPFHKLVRSGYLWQAREDLEHWFVVDADQDEGKIADIIWREVQKRFL